MIIYYEREPDRLAARRLQFGSTGSGSSTRCGSPITASAPRQACGLFAPEARASSIAFQKREWCRCEERGCAAFQEHGCGRPDDRPVGGCDEARLTHPRVDVAWAFRAGDET